jgi:hypothetical protein
MSQLLYLQQVVTRPRRYSLGYTDVHGRTILFHGMEEVVGSNPTRSTNILSSIHTGFLHISLRKELT